MKRTWQEHFDLEDQIRQIALRAGIAPRRAATLARTLACRPLDRTRASGTLANVGTPGSADPTIVEAHRLLTTLEPDAAPALTAIRLASFPASEGQCLRGVIFVNPDSTFYRTAQAGDPLPLAMLLHHEHFHATHAEADEAAAREASMRFCARHGLAIPHDLEENR